MIELKSIPLINHTAPARFLPVGNVNSRCMLYTQCLELSHQPWLDS